MLKNFATALSGLFLTVSLHAQEQEGLLVREGSAWNPASYSDAQLNKPGMLCIRYNNYWCIKGSTRDPWVGQTGMDDRKHAIFDTASHGARAFFVLMRTYHRKYGLRSTREIFNRYSPASDCVGSLPRDPATGECPQGENPTLAYARRVAEALGLGPEDDINLFDANGRARTEVAVALANGVVQFELGPNRKVTSELVLKGLSLANIEPIAAQP